MVIAKDGGDFFLSIDFCIAPMSTGVSPPSYVGTIGGYYSIYMLALIAQWRGRKETKLSVQ